MNFCNRRSSQYFNSQSSDLAVDVVGKEPLHARGRGFLRAASASRQALENVVDSPL